MELSVGARLLVGTELSVVGVLLAGGSVVGATTGELVGSVLAPVGAAVVKTEAVVMTGAVVAVAVVVVSVAVVGAGGGSTASAIGPVSS